MSDEGNISSLDGSASESSFQAEENAQDPVSAVDEENSRFGSEIDNFENSLIDEENVGDNLQLAENETENLQLEPVNSQFEEIDDEKSSQFEEINDGKSSEFEGIDDEKSSHFEEIDDGKSSQFEDIEGEDSQSGELGERENSPENIEKENPQFMEIDDTENSQFTGVDGIENSSTKDLEEDSRDSVHNHEQDSNHSNEEYMEETNSKEHFQSNKEELEDISPLSPLDTEDKRIHETESVYNVSGTQANDPNNSFLDSDANKENECDGKVNKRRSDEGLEFRDELDFEEEKESAEEGEESEGEPEKDPMEPINKEEGELSDEDEDESLLRQEPKTVCRFFNKGQCTWGTNCRFLHPGVSDKGNYNMFAAPKPAAPSEKEDSTTEKPREVRRFIPEPLGFESAWERGLRHAKEMKKRANKRKETDADFEEKRFNLSLGQAELDRENDYYTRPASPVYKPSDEVIEYLDPYEKQAIRHFRGGHFENFEVRYKVDANYPNRGPEHLRSRRDKFEREVTERVPRRLRPSSPVLDDAKVVKEKRYPRPRVWKEERTQDPPPPTVGGKGEAEVWADPWARRKTPVKRTKKKKVPRTRSYSSGSSSRSSRSSRSSSYSSYSKSRSGSRSTSRSSRSSSRSITPPIHPRLQRATMNRGRGRGGRGERGNQRGFGPHRNPYQNQQFSQPPNPPPNHPLAPDVTYQRPPMPPLGNRRNNPRDVKDNRLANQRKPGPRNIHPDLRGRLPMQFKQEPRKFATEPRERVAIPAKADPRNVEPRERPNVHRKQELRLPVTNPPERVDMFGRTIRKDVPRSPSPKSASRSPIRSHGRRKFSLSPVRSRSSSGSSRSRSGSRSLSRSRSRSSSSASSITPHQSPVAKRKAERVRRPAPATVSYGESTKSKAIDLVKVAGQKQQIKLTLKKPGQVKPIDKTVLGVDDDSGESDTDARILKKRKMDTAPPNPPPAKVAKPRAPSPTALASLTSMSSSAKKPSAARREELLKQLRAVEDAIARKKSKPV